MLAGSNFIQTYVMKYRILYICLIPLLTACSKQGFDKKNLDSRLTINSSYIPNTALDTVTYSSGVLDYKQVARTGSTVFRYSMSKVYLGTNDMDDYNELVFQADSGINWFSYTDADMATHYTHYSQGGGWGIFTTSLLYKGSIVGERTSDSSWKVKIDVSLPEKDDITGKNTIKEELVFSIQPQL